MPASRATTTKRDKHARPPAGEEIHGAVSASVLLGSFAKRPTAATATSITATSIPAAAVTAPSSTEKTTASATVSTTNGPAAAVSSSTSTVAPPASTTTPAAVPAAGSAPAVTSSSFTTPSKRKVSQTHSASASTTATPLPTQPLALPVIADIKQTLHRRRSSYPPATIAPPAGNSAFVFGGTPIGRSVSTLESLPGFGTEYTVTDGMAWTPGAGWEGLLDLGSDTTTANANTANLQNAVVPAIEALANSSKAPTVASLAVAPGITRLRSNGKEPAPPYAPVAQSPNIPATGLASVNRMAQFGNDLVWRTILGSRVDVEEVGEVGVARVLQEVWRRGGGDAVTSQALWPTILIALSFSTDGSSPSTRIPTPSSRATAALQSLYMLTLRHWEPAIFSGLLASFVSSAATPATEAPHGLLNSSHTHSLPALDLSQGSQSFQQSLNIYGPATPKAELDLSQWMNVTPGAEWSFFGNMGQNSGPAASGSSPRPHTAPNGMFVGPGPSSLAHEVTEVDTNGGAGGGGSRSGMSVSAMDAEEQIRGIDELLAQIERGQEANEMAQREQESAAAQQLANNQAFASAAAAAASKTKPFEPTFQLPTPDTDGSSDSPAQPKSRRKSTLSSRTDSASQASSVVPSGQPTPPSSAGSPFAPGSATSGRAEGLVVKGAAPSARANAPTQLAMPTQQFVPPPPMCMFFSPAFHDLQTDKVGVWKGDLELRGRGGGKFAVLIIGEQKTGHLWQSHLWPENISYPPDEQANLSCTATMIPVAHLAREGFTPVAMGMVLCNDDNLSAFVTMVQGLHAEGVAFHLPGSTRLPIVFLPAKFDFKDPLQRLGVAFMSKPGWPIPPPPPMPAAGSPIVAAQSGNGAEQTSPDDGPRRKRRRQSAPAKTHPALPVAPAGAAATTPTTKSSAGGRGSSKSRRGTAAENKQRVEENAIAEEDNEEAAAAAAA